MNPFLKHLAVLFFACASPLAEAEESPDQKAIQDAFNSVVNAQQSQDYPALAHIMHPRGLRIFRRYLHVAFEKLESRYSPGDLLAVTGLGKSPAQLELSDADFFIVACENAARIDAGFGRLDKHLPITYHGSVPDENDRAYIVYSYADSLASEETSLDFERARTMQMANLDGKWLVVGGALAPTVFQTWSVELQKREKERKDAETRQPEVAPGERPSKRRNMNDGAP